MVVKDWFYENWGKTRRRFAYFPIQIGPYYIWWEYYDETLTGQSTNPLNIEVNQWELSYPSTCTSKKFVKMGYGQGGGFFTSAQAAQMMAEYLDNK